MKWWRGGLTLALTPSWTSGTLGMTSYREETYVMMDFSSGWGTSTSVKRKKRDIKGKLKIYIQKTGWMYDKCVWVLNYKGHKYQTKINFRVFLWLSLNMQICVHWNWNWNILDSCVCNLNNVKLKQKENNAHRLNVNMFDAAVRLLSPSGSSSLVTPSSLSAVLKACSRFSWLLCRYTWLMSIRVGLQTATRTLSGRGSPHCFYLLM